jgi:DNA-binding MarR family transcriptional regulator
MIIQEKDRGLILLELLLTFQRKRRIISNLRGTAPDEAGPAIGYAEECVLQLTKSGKGKSIKALAESTHIERSWMSRVVSSLEERELVSLKADPLDGRSKLVSTTSAGDRALSEINVFAAGVMDEALADLTKRECASLAQSMKHIVDGFQAPPAPLQPDADQLDVQLARLSRAIGVFGPSFLSSDLNLTQVHILLLLASTHSDSTVAVRDLDFLLPFDMSTISRTVAIFEEEGFLTKTQSSTDRRSFTLELTKQGIAKLAEFKKIASRSMAAALERVAPAEVANAVQLLGKATALMPRSLGARERPEVIIRSVQSADVPAHARPKSKDTSNNLVTHFFTAERSGTSVAEISLTRHRNSKTPVDVKVRGNFTSTAEVSEVLHALADQLG